MSDVMPKPLYTKFLKNGTSSYYIDVKMAKNGKPYLVIAETGAFQGKPTRNTIRVFGPETVQKMASALIEAADVVVNPGEQLNLAQEGPSDRF